MTGSTGKLVHSPTGNNASIFSEFPVARNVSIQSTVEFTCAVPNGEYVLYFSWSADHVFVKLSPMTFSQDGVKSRTLIITASANNTNISCSAGGFINGIGVFEESPPALLLIQGT